MAKRRAACRSRIAACTIALVLVGASCSGGGDSDEATEKDAPAAKTTTTVAKGPEGRLSAVVADAQAARADADGEELAEDADLTAIAEELAAEASSTTDLDLPRVDLAEQLADIDGTAMAVLHAYDDAGNEISDDRRLSGEKTLPWPELISARHDRYGAAAVEDDEGSITTVVLLGGPAFTDDDLAAREEELVERWGARFEADDVEAPSRTDEMDEFAVEANQLLGGGRKAKLDRDGVTKVVDLYGRIAGGEGRWASTDDLGEGDNVERYPTLSYVSRPLGTDASMGAACETNDAGGADCTVAVRATPPDAATVDAWREEAAQDWTSAIDDARAVRDLESRGGGGEDAAHIAASCSFAELGAADPFGDIPEAESDAVFATLDQNPWYRYNVVYFEPFADIGYWFTKDDRRGDNDDPEQWTRFVLDEGYRAYSSCVAFADSGLMAVATLTSSGENLEDSTPVPYPTD